MPRTPGLVHRRLILAAGALALAVPRLARAFPQRPITVVVPFPPGGGVDAVARAVAERMAGALGATILADNRPGGSTSIAAAQVARAEPDGHTLLIGTPALSINPVLQPQLPPGDPRRVLAPIGRIATLPYILHVGPAGAAMPDLAAMIAWGRAIPGQLDIANSGTATATHLAAALFAHRAGIEVTHIPYRGGAPAALDVVAGRVHGMFAQAIEVAPLLREGQTRALAVTTAARSAAFPAIPAVGETLPGYDIGSWNGLFAPAGTPAPVIARLNEALQSALADPALAQRFAPQAVSFLPGPPAALAALLEAEITGWTALVAATGIRAT